MSLLESPSCNIGLFANSLVLLIIDLENIELGSCFFKKIYVFTLYLLYADTIILLWDLNYFQHLNHRI